MNAHADVLVLCGDLTDHGRVDEAQVLARELQEVQVPVVAVLGNHDHDSPEREGLVGELERAGVKVLQGDAAQLGDLGIAGTKGSGGGFGSTCHWVETACPSLASESMEEASRMREALGRLNTRRRIAITHYAPTRDTLVGEPTRLYPHLGSKRMEDSLLGAQLDAVLHGHAHRGAPEGRLRNGTPVYNVSMPVLLRHFPDRPPYRIVEMPGLATRGSAAVRPQDDTQRWPMFATA